MKTYRISAIKAKAKRLGSGYLEDCQTLANTWDEARGEATFDNEALAEIRATWQERGQQATSQPCRNCRGL